MIKDTTEEFALRRLKSVKERLTINNILEVGNYKLSTKDQHEVHATFWSMYKLTLTPRIILRLYNMIVNEIMRQGLPLPAPTEKRQELSQQERHELLLSQVPGLSEQQLNEVIKTCAASLRKLPLTAHQIRFCQLVLHVCDSDTIQTTSQFCKKVSKRAIRQAYDQTMTILRKGGVKNSDLENPQYEPAIKLILSLHAYRIEQHNKDTSAVFIVKDYGSLIKRNVYAELPWYETDPSVSRLIDLYHQFLGENHP